MPISIHQGRTPPPFCNVVDIDARLPSARFLCSMRQLVGAFPDRHFWVSFFSIRPSYLEGRQAFPQVSYFKGTMIVNLCEVSQTLFETLPAHLTEVTPATDCDLESGCVTMSDPQRPKKKSRSVTCPRLVAELWLKPQWKSLRRSCNNWRRKWVNSAR